MSDVQHSKPTTGAEDVRWDLGDLYTDLDDPRLDTDLDELVAEAEAFGQAHRGKLKQTLGQSLVDRARMEERALKLMLYLHLRRSTDAANPRIQQRMGVLFERWSAAEADHLNFFDHELVAIDDETYAAILERDEVARRHRSMLDHLRANRQYLLEENVERALTLRSPFGASEWGDYVEELESLLRFRFDDRELTLPEILHVITNDLDGDRRAAALASLSGGMTEQRFDQVMARTLNVVLGAKGVEDKERGYGSPMSSRNIGNRVDDATVEALHEAVAELGAVQGRRYYRLLAAHLGRRPLRWSDRNAPLPFADNRLIPWQECVDTVLAAYGSFSPTLRDLVQSMIDRRWIDAPPYLGKTGGAFNFSVLLPGGEARSYNFLNYLGSTRDVMTVAHEVGHGVHGMLAARAQGVLMYQAPMAYAETASIFGEMTTFRYLLERTASDEQRLALLMDKCSDHINTVVRQISFSNFERTIHAQRRQGKLTNEDFDAAWMDVTRAFYGPEGELFTYESTHNLWAYVTHFLRPFYVYAYAFGELFTQSLYAVQGDLGARFEGMYLDLLRAGGSKSAVELMEPFGLDPRDPEFWRRGITGSVATWLDEAEAISARMGVVIE
ncbi:M3 family oligoendopeptidase [Paraliomyxa miuraensis]|uniref:M3 family oligoendopeptidase n=1 Tax=Paraliomyxa miuraensis TaxID=376150 RepID=UPI00224CAC74|nr:M3 family oligoendopeptidase [Paraliomyxa miuraensis]MCX4246745.1 M3 family oligoendopeptidase [Paraliomyxa miuraensis]